TATTSAGRSCSSTRRAARSPMAASRPPAPEPGRRPRAGSSRRDPRESLRRRPAQPLGDDLLSRSATTCSTVATVPPVAAVLARPGRLARLDDAAHLVPPLRRTGPRRHPDEVVTDVEAVARGAAAPGPGQVGPAVLGRE